MRVLNWRHSAYAAGIVAVSLSALAIDAMAGELRRGVLPPKCTPAPVEPAPPNAGYYPTWWNRWDTEAAYLPGLRRPEGPPETKEAEEELPQPDVGPPPLTPLTPPPETPREKEPAPKPPATPPKPVEPAPMPRNGDLPPLPGGQREPEPMPVPPAPGPTQPAPEPDIFEPPKNETPAAPKKEEKPVAPEPMPEPMELPAPTPMDKKPDAEPKLPEPDQPEKPEPRKPMDDLFEAPPRSGDAIRKQGANLLDRPLLETNRVKGTWVAVGGSPSDRSRSQHVVAPASDEEDISSPNQHQPAQNTRPARLPADDDAVPLSAVRRGEGVMPRPARGSGAATARITTVRDSAVQGVQWIEPDAKERQLLLNPLRGK